MVAHVCEEYLSFNRAIEEGSWEKFRSAILFLLPLLLLFFPFACVHLCLEILNQTLIDPSDFTPVMSPPLKRMIIPN
jgi:hypothetical protein